MNIHIKYSRLSYPTSSQIAGIELSEFPGNAEAIFVGYRYYDARKMDVLFPFGYGLSYTEFSYSNLMIDKSRITAKDTLMVSLDVTNTGSMEGKEIVQLYVSDKTHSASRPVRELKNFAAVTLKPGETKTVSMELDYRAFAWYDTEQKDWYAAGGTYEICIGKSSRDIVMRTEVVLENEKEKLPKIDENVMIGDLMDCAKTADYVEERLMPYIGEFIGKTSMKEMDEMERSMVYYMPLSSLRSFTKLDNEGLGELVDELENHVR